MRHQEMLRGEIESYLDQRDWTRAHSSLGRLWQLERKAATAAYALSCYERLRGQIPLVPCRIAFLRSMTIEPLMPILRATALVSGIDLTTYAGPFNAYAQEILDPSSALYAFRPDIVVLTVQTRDFAYDLWERFPDLSEVQVRTCCERIKDEIVGWVRSFRSFSDAHLVVHTFEKPLPSQGILDHQTNSSQLATIERLNQELVSICREFRGVHVLDYDALVARHGKIRWHDEGKWLTMRMPFAADSVAPMVNEWMKFIHPLCGVSCKMLAVDLDNTLWGGVVGEDGVEGIKIGQEYPGASYHALQRAILDLYRRGVILGICSKNNVADAMAVLENHQGMLLRPQHFSAIRVNWCDKAQNLREIAAELNIGIDAIAFLDDSPVEREWVRSELQEVKIIDLPDSANGYAEALRDCPWFERVSLSQEDRNRAFLYQQQQQRLEITRTSNSLEDFYRSLDQEVTITPLTPETLARVAQLTQKTNQFNLTTRRYSEQQVQEFASTPGCSVYSVRVTDRFGDNGIVGVLITHRIGDVCEIDTFLLSCRVIGRTIETAVLGFLAEQSRAEGARLLRGWFIPTKKNAPVRDVYASHQFKLAQSRHGATLWHLDLSEGVIECPEWIRLLIAKQALIPETVRA